MKCVVCKHGETAPGAATVLLERGDLTLVVKRVPARICGNCGERYFDAATTAHLLTIVEQAASAGVQVDIREYVAA
jgi:YgiT-type zinc finger domain-containing protein